jgi:hypothetical protein
MIRPAFIILVSPIVASALNGCGACPTVAGSGVQVEVRDRQTGAYLATVPRGLVRDGNYQDSLRVAGDLPPQVTRLIGAFDRPGQYVVQIEADGYLPWDTAGVNVNQGDCGVGVASFIAALEAVP